MVVDVLRRFFELNPRTAAYRWKGKVADNGQIETDEAHAKVRIAVDTGDQPKFWPYVLLRSVDGDLQDLFLGQRHGTLVVENVAYSELDAVQAQQRGDDYDVQRYLEVGERIGGMSELRVTLVVGTTGTGPKPENARVVGLVRHGLVGDVRRQLSLLNLDWIPSSCHFDAPVIRDLSDRSKECETTLSFKLRVQWYEDFYYTAETVDEILIQRAYLKMP